MISLFSRTSPRNAQPGPSPIPPYGNAVAASLRPWRWWLLAGFTVFCFLYGAFFAITAPMFIVPLSIPLAVMGLMAIWALPDLNVAPTRAMTTLLLAFTIFLFAWPNYLAIALPGLPWITFLRLTGVPMTLLLLVSLSVSKAFRAQLSASLQSSPLVWKFMAGFVVIQLVTIVFSKNIPFSVQKFIVFQTNWTAVFVVSCYAFLQPKRAERFLFVVWGLAVFVCAIALWEFSERKILWQGHIPSFLKIDDADNILKASTRYGTGVYRVKATFTTPLGLSEFLALASPIAMHMVMGRYNFFVRVLGAASLALFFYVIRLTDARLGVAGFLVAGLAFVLGWSVYRWLKERGSLIASAIVFGYPALFCATVAATFVVPGLRKMVWGGGAQRASSNARHAQIERGIPVILQEPWGHGPGQGGRALGYYSFSFLTIDNYYLAIALEYGVLGFILYYGMIALSIWNSGTYYLASRDLADREFDLLLPLMAMLSAFFVIKAVFSQQDNHPLIYLALGMVVALVYRIQTASKQSLTAPPAIRRTVRHGIARFG